MLVIPDSIVPEKTSLVAPDISLVIPASVHLALVRYNIRKAAEEDPSIMEKVMKWQAAIDARGCGGCYDAARPGLAARMPA
jgi:hypothetical protein